MKKLAKAVTAVLAVGALGTLVFMRMTKSPWRQSRIHRSRWKTLRQIPFPSPRI